MWPKLQCSTVRKQTGESIPSFNTDALRRPERRKFRFADLGKTKYGCRIFELVH